MPFIERTVRFKRDLKRVLKRGKDIKKLKNIVLKLLDQAELPRKFKDHRLIGGYSGARECHIEPDWLLIYRLLRGGIRLERTGTHSDLFE
ncbi:MAG: type II toxin-antitoxin system YafQ family toxin [Gammaproteobacteria bacterium]|jgi:mRNA interferase YafQ